VGSLKSRGLCQICRMHKWHYKVLLNPAMVTVRVCRFCMEDLAGSGVKVVVLWGSGGKR